MTVAATTTAVQYVQNGTTTQFSYPNKIFSASDLVVTDINSATVPPTLTVLTLGTNYTVSNVDVDTGAFVTLLVAGVSGHTLDIRTQTALTQSTSVKNQGAFYPELHEEAFDRFTRQIQDLTRLAYTFGVHGPDTESVPWPALPAASLRANTTLVFGANGLPGVGVTPTTTFTQALFNSYLESGALYPQTQVEINAGVTPTALLNSPSPVYNMARYGLWENVANGGPAPTDVNSPIIQAVFNMAKVTGGKIVFPPGDYSFYLDISGQTNAAVTIDGQGGVFRPYSSTPTNSCVIYCNNYTGTLGQWYQSNVTITDVTIFGLKYVPTVSTGDVNYGVYFNCTSAKFYRVTFYAAQTAAFYGLFAQYTEFWSCKFTEATANSGSAGCFLDSNSLVASSNEVLFNRCFFIANSIGLWLKGAQKTRVMNCTVQGNSVAGVQMDYDSSGSATCGTLLFGCWFEENNPGSNIIGNICVDTTIDGCIFWGTGGVNQIYFTHCSGVNFTNNSWQGGGSPVISLLHPSGNTDTVSIVWRGNINGDAVQNPTVFGIAHAGLYNLDLHWEFSFTATLTGCTTSPTATTYATVEGNCVDLHLPNLTATSNSTALTFTGLPAILQPAATQNGIAPLVNNGSSSAQFVEVTSSSGTVTAFYNGSSSGFTNSGTKGFTTGVFRYPLFN